MDNKRTIKIFSGAGDGYVGKTCVIIRYAKGEYPKDYVPTVFDNWVTNVPVNEFTVEVGIWDYAGREESDRLRPLSYANTSAVMVFFAVNSITSFENVSKKWFPEIHHYCPEIPWILVATKSDLRTNPTEIQKLEPQKMISYQEGLELAQKLGAYSYVETSALTGEGVQEAFNQAIRAVFEPKKKSKSGLSLLWQKTFGSLFK